MSEAPRQNKTEALLTALHNLLGEEGLITDDNVRRLYSQDIYTEGALVAAVVRPDSSQLLAEVLKTAGQYQTPVLPRSGGMSYTQGYISDKKNALLIDLSRLDKLISLDTDNMTVRVQAGCTWKQLHQTLAPEKLRTPYWGTLSGHQATVGGSLSNNSIFWGSGRFGSATESVLSLQVALMSGELIETGASAAQVNSGVAFLRQFGPDLTGVFLGDCGALGIKTEIELPLMDEYEAHDYASFDFADGEKLLAALSEISRRGLASECFGFDPVLQGQRLKRASLLEDMQMASGVVNLKKPLQTLASLMKLGIAGRRFVKQTAFTLHCILSEHTAACARRKRRQIYKIVRRYQGRVIADSIPRLMQANPFPPLNNISGALGERWAPVHGLFPHSKVQQAFQKTRQLFESHSEAMNRLGITAGYLLSSINRQTTVLEPVFYWQDALQALHKKTMDDAVLKTMPGFPESQETRAYVGKMRLEIAGLYHSLGAAHLQIGRTYLYRQGQPETNWRLVETLKKELDPDGLMNPGVLGFDG